jgi:hypothetical protein
VPYAVLYEARETSTTSKYIQTLDTALIMAANMLTLINEACYLTSHKDICGNAVSMINKINSVIRYGITPTKFERKSVLVAEDTTNVTMPSGG